ncbi:unnamed protein product [Clavelina lepadiformis]|uniref:Uncharacterized protein n=1 Tax=Clavelina lepadiformis TaxID=159417 RepID=A0ABP0FH70_CLALP
MTCLAGTSLSMYQRQMPKKVLSCNEQQRHHNYSKIIIRAIILNNPGLDINAQYYYHIRPQETRLPPGMGFLLCDGNLYVPEGPSGQLWSEANGKLPMQMVLPPPPQPPPPMTAPHVGFVSGSSE